MGTIKGKPVFEYEDYLYIINNKLTNKMIWCCRIYRHGQCRGRLHTVIGQVMQLVGEHNHEPVHSAGEVVEARTKMAHAAKQTINTTHGIVSDSISSLSDHAIASLPTLKTVKRTIQRLRQKHQNP